MKKKNFKKSSIILVTTALVGSQLTVFVPANAMESSKNVEGYRASEELHKGLKSLEQPMQRTLAVDSKATEVVVDVSSPAELEQALNSSNSANVIRFTNDITLIKDLTTNKSVRFEGNGRQLSFSGKRIVMAGSAKIDLINISLFNGGTGSTKAMFIQEKSSSNPTINVLGDVVSSGYLFSAPTGGSLTVAGKNNSFSGSQSSMIADVNDFKVEDNAQIKKMEAVDNAIKVGKSGTISIGKYAEMNIQSNTGYSYYAPNSTLLIGEGAIVNSTSLYGGISVNAMQIDNDAKLDLSSGKTGTTGTGIKSTRGITIGDNTSIKVSGSGNGVQTTGTGSVITFGIQNDINIESAAGSGIVTDGLNIGVESDVLVNSYKDAIVTDKAGVSIGEISNRPVSSANKNKISITSGYGNGIYSKGNILLGDNIETNIQAYRTALYAGGSTSSLNVSLGAFSTLTANSEIEMGVNTAAMNIGEGTSASIKAKTTGINLGRVGNGLNTSNDVKLFINAENGIVAGKNLDFKQNNNLEINALSGYGISTTDSSKVTFDKNSLVKIQAKTGIRQVGSASSLDFKEGSALQIYNTEQHGIVTEGSITFDKKTSTNIKAAQVGVYSAVKADGVVRFDSDSKVIAQTLSNQSTSVFDLSGRVNSRLEIINPRLMDIKQINHYEPGKGRLIKGATTTNEGSQTRLILDSVEELYAWNRGQSWGSAPSYAWSDVTSVTRFVKESGNVRYDYYGGPTTGTNVNGFDIYNYSRLATHKENTSMSETTIDELTTESTVVSGTAEPGASIEIKVGDTIIGRGTADANGNYSISISPQKEGTVVTAQAFLGTEKSNTAQTTVKGNSKGVIIPSDYTVGESTITGSYTGDIVKAQLYVNGQYISIGGTFVDGKFSYYVPAGLIKETDKVELVALDKDNNILDRKPVNVLAVKAALNPADYTVGQTNITGTYTGDVARAQLYVNGQYISTGGTFADGKFTYYVQAGLIKETDIVELVALDTNGNVVDRKPVNVLAGNKGTITPSVYTVGTSTITGFYTGEVAKAQLYVNDKYVSTGGTFVDGKFTYYVQAGLIKETDKVELVALNKNNDILDRKSVTVKG
ncbi:hypothetical protein HCJ57_14050 [Listeria booriae]|uniref:immunoglobulin-like domain-containing protein n=1 Tax=Listeria booriae TaxID=1552123 RepID=UPI001627F97D|nr:immunoglobulin-like domain-containing protein [Listeria booriae]MBC2057645.1 hypothetical protein [Listeria booriae]